MHGRAVRRELHRVEVHNRTSTAGAAEQGKKGGKHKKISFATALWLCLVPQRTKCVEAQSEGKSTFFIQSKTASSLIGGEGGGDISCGEKEKKQKSNGEIKKT